MERFWLDIEFILLFCEKKNKNFFSNFSDENRVYYFEKSNENENNLYS